MGKGRHVFTIDDNAEMAEANAWMAMRAHVCVCTIDNIIDNIEAIGGTHDNR